MNIRIKITIVITYIKMQEVALFVLLWVCVLLTNRSIALFFIDFMNVFCICSLEQIIVG